LIVLSFCFRAGNQFIRHRGEDEDAKANEALAVHTGILIWSAQGRHLPS